MSVQKIANAFKEWLNPTECLQEIVLAYTNYMVIAEQEQTKRREFTAWEQTTISRIHEQPDLLIAYLDRSFDERAKNFHSLFCIAEQAIIIGNNEQLALALHSITELAKSSPFKELANLASVKATLKDPDHEWTF